MEISGEIARLYGHRVRTRVCGILIHDGAILLVKHLGLSKAGFLWTPPGGGMQYGMDSEANLVREFKEETGLHVKVERFLFVYEYLGVPLQTIELFYEVSRTGGDLIKGKDPEMTDSQQIIDEVRFVSFEELGQFEPESIHYMLQGVSYAETLLHKTGLFKFEKN